jgi:large subunit ribosomal protein L4
MKLDVYNLQNAKVGEIEVDDAIFGAPVKPYLHHDVVRAQLAARRSGTACAKTRGEIKHTTKKLYRQKGTGRARQGSGNAPHFVGGGRAFPPKPRSYAMKLNKKTRRAALMSVLSEKVQQGHLKVVDGFELEAIKTKAALGALTTLGAGKALVVDQAGNDNLRLSVRNLRDHKYIAADGLNVYDLLRFDHLVVTRSAIEQIQGALSR